MGDIADYHVSMYSGGVWGVPVAKKRVFPSTTKDAIKDSIFYVVEVIGGNTNRVLGTKLVVCDNTEESYWVYTSSGVTGIQKNVCKVLSKPLTLSEAKDFRNGLPKKCEKLITATKKGNE